ncbi:DHA2 family efflux MFS transporter permease subunit [uncultured Methanobrevibacter sp.]|uniref:DHA2 family efflux MFS transporter permease subunit n=1 Tax=uncultured Methanobrevibacter sp. TaxID=253161 RepID=UPI00258F86C5|nr:DHA2 family efflux MFS transporter permease subunit [uncultured Methanobrevibacter sp.]
MDNIFKIEKGKTIIAILIIGGFISMLNETALNVAFPHIMVEYAISAGIVQWLTTGYVLVSGIVFLMTAFLMKKYTTRKLFLTAMLLLIVGSIISAASFDFPMILAGRIIQALGTGIIVPLVFNSVMYITIPQRRGFMMGIVSLVVLSAPIFAPVIMGLIMEFTDWHLYFVIMLILFIICAVIASRKLENITDTGDAKLDVVSLILAAIGLTLIIYGFSHLSDEGLLNVIITLVVGLFFLILFGYRQLHSDHPLLRISVFKNKIFTIGIITNLANVMLIFAIVVLIPMYLETSLHTSSLTASLIMLPGTILGSVLPILSGHIYDDHGPRIVICTGTAIMALSAFLLTMVDLSTSFIVIVLIICGFYIGSGLSLSPNQTNTLGNLKSEDYPSGSAIMTSSQQIGGAIGSSLFTSFMTIGQNNYLSAIANPTAVQHALALAKGVNFSFEIGTIFLLMVFVLTLFLKRNKNYDL